jgi:hypothetical protein
MMIGIGKIGRTAVAYAFVGFTLAGCHEDAPPSLRSAAEETECETDECFHAEYGGLEDEPLPGPDPNLVVDGAEEPCDAPDGAAAACAPIEYQTMLELWRFRLKMAPLAHHSSTRLIRRRRQNGKIVNADSIDNPNDGRAPGGAGGVNYRTYETAWTNMAGVGFTTYDRVNLSPGVMVGGDAHPNACSTRYGFRNGRHVCHGDTDFQVYNFHTIPAGNAATFPNCISGRFRNTAPHAP